jgi:molybdopterin-containing oxidoreductase family membrane subunit
MGIGRIGARWLATCALLACLVAFGVYGYAQQRLHGDVVTGMRTIGEGGPAWALYICFDIVLVGLAFAGIAVTTLTRLFRIKELWPLSRMAELLAVVSLMMAGLCVLADLGRPLHGLLNLPRYARTMSPFFGTFTLIMGAGLTASVVYLVLDGRADAAWCAERTPRFGWFYRAGAFGFRNTEAEHLRHSRVSRGLSIVMLPLIVIAYSTLGFVFGIQGGRPGWFSALQAPGFVVLAAVSGTGVLIAIAAAVRTLLGLEELITEKVFRWLGLTLAIGIFVYVYFIAVEELTARYASSQAQNEVAEAIVSGHYSRLFWIMIAFFVAPLALLVLHAMRQTITPRVAVTAGLLVQVAAVLKRYLLVVPSQTHGTLSNWPVGSYTPSWVELSAITGLFALGALLYLVYIKVYPIIPLQSLGVLESRAVPRESRRSGATRRFLFMSTLLFGLALAVTGFALSARVGTLPYLDPIVPFSPVMFIAGMVIVFMSAVVYETLPSAAAGSDAPSST